MIQGLTIAALVGAVAIAAPGSARLYLERSLGVEPSIYALGDLITLRGAVEVRDGERVRAIAGDDVAFAHLTGAVLAQAPTEGSTALDRTRKTAPKSL